jgi:hypothetical protein
MSLQGQEHVCSWLGSTEEVAQKPDVAAVDKTLKRPDRRKVIYSDGNEFWGLGVGSSNLPAPTNEIK